MEKPKHYPWSMIPETFQHYLRLFDHLNNLQKQALFCSDTRGMFYFILFL